jgi:hypothetical protein
MNLYASCLNFRLTDSGLCSSTKPRTTAEVHRAVQMCKADVQSDRSGRQGLYLDLSTVLLDAEGEELDEAAEESSIGSRAALPGAGTRSLHSTLAEVSAAAHIGDHEHSGPAASRVH